MSDKHKADATQGGIIKTMSDGHPYPDPSIDRDTKRDGARPASNTSMPTGADAPEKKGKAKRTAKEDGDDGEGGGEGDPDEPSKVHTLRIVDSVGMPDRGG